MEVCHEHSPEILRPSSSSRSRELNSNVLIVFGNDPASLESDVATGLRISQTLDRTPVLLAPTALQYALTIFLQTREEERRTSRLRTSLMRG